MIVILRGTLEIKVRRIMHLVEISEFLFIFALSLLLSKTQTLTHIPQTLLKMLPPECQGWCVKIMLVQV